MHRIAWIVIASLLAGCATARLAPAGITPERLAEIQKECETTAAQGAESEAVKTGLKWGALSGLYLAFVGAAEGAWFGAVTGGSAGEAAWIGAAAGAGIGALIGLAAGIKTAVDARRGYSMRYEQCVSERTARPAAGAEPHVTDEGGPPASPADVPAGTLSSVF
jgi:hypothetical protein